MRKDKWISNERFLAKVFEMAQLLPGPVIVAGDFNIERQRSGVLTTILRAGWTDVGLAFGNE
eukprot:8418320-Heterocapsa_arctica.AAC.1